jgi:DMSO/TMAO reductase YedYZ molybdopterin-dependent catalytic subunit
MKRSSIFILALLVTLSILLASCTSTKATPTPEAPKFTFTFLGQSKPTYLSLEDLKKLPATEGMGGIVSSTGKITLPELYKGVALKDLVAAYGGNFDSSMGLTLTAEDGYSMTYSYDQVMNGDFPAYDPALGKELTNHDPLTAILAYERNGQPLDPVQDGVLRLVIVSAKNNQVTDGHWSVKWINQAQVEAVGATWTLDLEGATLSPVDRASFQSCGSPGCHGVEWHDENGQTWEGVPLWLLIGQVDDENSHDDKAFNDALADAGYTVDVVGSDGFTVTFDSASIKRNGNFIVAYLVNGSELPDKYYPLRLVGTGLEKSQMVGQITKIIVHVPAAATPTVAAPQGNAGSLAITGMVNQELTFNDANLRAMQIVTVTAEGKNGQETFQGVKLNALLDLAGIKDGATKLVFIASDNYSAEVNLADVRSCSNALLAFTDTPGVYMVVLPEQPTSTWVKNLVSIEVK